MLYRILKTIIQFQFLEFSYPNVSKTLSHHTISDLRDTLRSNYDVSKEIVVRTAVECQVSRSMSDFICSKAVHLKDEPSMILTIISSFILAKVTTSSKIHITPHPVFGSLL